MARCGVPHPERPKLLCVKQEGHEGLHITKWQNPYPTTLEELRRNRREWAEFERRNRAVWND
jgi:hypothetical protein